MSLDDFATEKNSDGAERGAHGQHASPGLSKKVLNERLRKLVRFGVLAREAYPEVPPRVEYRLTEFGEKFAGVMEGVERLQSELEQRGASTVHLNAR